MVILRRLRDQHEPRRVKPIDLSAAPGAFDFGPTASRHP